MTLRWGARSCRSECFTSASFLLSGFAVESLRRWDQIAAMKADQGWGQILNQLKAQGLVQDTNLGQVISRYNHTAKTTSTPTIVTTGNGRSPVVAGGHGRSWKTAGVAPMDGRSTFSRSLTDPGGHGSAHGDAVSHGRGSNHGGGTAAGRDR